MSKYNKINKLILSFTTAAALGATAVVISNQINNPVTQLFQTPVVHADSTDII